VSQHTLVAELTALGVPLWLDAAVSSPIALTTRSASAVTRVVVGLETLPLVRRLGEIALRWAATASPSVSTCVTESPVISPASLGTSAALRLVSRRTSSPRVRPAPALAPSS